ncbi:MAG: GNAT family N-acetyltransferase [Nostocoides sp.]
MSSSAIPPRTSVPNGVPELTDGTVRLRALEDGDIPAIVAQSNDPEVVRWTTVPHPYADTDARAYLDETRTASAAPDGTRLWGIETAAHPFAGLIDLRFRGRGLGEVGYSLSPAARGTGIMARAVRIAARYAFTTGPWGQPLERIHWHAQVGNFASRRVAWACGFTHHGTIPGGARGRRADATECPVDLWAASLGANDPMQPATPWWDIPRIVGDRVVLRAWNEGDQGAAQPMDIPGHFMPDGAAPNQLTFASWLLERRERAAAGTCVQWCIADKATDQAYGSVLIFSNHAVIDPPGAELGYFLVPAARGRGLATEAARLAIGHAFEPERDGGLELSRLTAVTAADNTASNAVLQRLGFARWGVEHRTDALPGGGWQDAFHWELLR